MLFKWTKKNIGEQQQEQQQRRRRGQGQKKRNVRCAFVIQSQMSIPKSTINLSVRVRTIKNKSNEPVPFIYHFLWDSRRWTFPENSVNVCVCVCVCVVSNVWMSEPKIINKCGKCNEISINGEYHLGVKLQEREREERENTTTSYECLCSFSKSKGSPVID